MADCVYPPCSFFYPRNNTVFPNIFSSMKEPERAGEMLKKSYVVVSLAYAVTATFGYLMYGVNTKEQITLNLPSDMGGTVITVLIIVNAYTKYALTLHPIAVGFEEFTQVCQRRLSILFEYKTTTPRNPFIPS